MGVQDKRQTKEYIIFFYSKSIGNGFFYVIFSGPHRFSIRPLIDLQVLMNATFLKSPPCCYEMLHLWKLAKNSIIMFEIMKALINRVVYIRDLTWLDMTELISRGHHFEHTWVAEDHHNCFISSSDEQRKSKNDSQHSLSSEYVIGLFTVSEESWKASTQVRIM